MKLSNQQRPMEEAAERIAESVPARTIPFLAAIQDMRVNWADHRQRVKDSHKVQAVAAGYGKLVKDNGSDEVPGDITVSGDTVTENHYHKSTNGIIGKLVLGAALGGGGLIGAGIVKVMQEIPPVVTDTDTQYNLRLSPIPQ